MPDTTLQQQNQLNQAKAAVEHITPQSIDPNKGSVIPNVYTQNLKPQAAAQYSGVTPPSVSEIHKGMWEGSFMVALMAGLATGNAGAAITAGLWGSIAIHDHGYTLRQRAEYVPQLQKDGYSALAIQDWFTTGKNDELDKERQFKEQAQRDADNLAERKSESTQRHSEFEEGQANQTQRQQAQMANQNRIAGMQIAAGDRRAALARQTQQQSGFKQEAMERRQSIMAAVQNNKDQFKAMQRSGAALNKAKADIALGTPMATQTLELMGQLIDAPNASVKLSQLHHIEQGAAHGLVDKAAQYMEKLYNGQPLTSSQQQDLMDVIEAGHQAQQQTYYEQVGQQASQLTDPAELKNFAIANGLSESQLQRAVGTYNAAENGTQAPADEPAESAPPAAPTAPDGNKVMTWAQFQAQASKGAK